MLKIVRVGGLDDERVDIEFSNGSIVLLNMKTKMNEPYFSVLREDNLLCYPRTDGERVYWRCGPSLTVAEIFEILQESPDGQQ